MPRRPRGSRLVRRLPWCTCVSASMYVERKKENRHAKRGMGRGQGPHLHEQDFGRTIRGTGGALLLLTRDTTGSQRGARWTPTSTGGLISLEVLEVDILWPRWVARIGVTRATEACFLTADRQCTELPLLRLPRLVPEVVGCDPCVPRDLARVGWRGLAARKGCVRSQSP